MGPALSAAARLLAAQQHQARVLAARRELRGAEVNVRPDVRALIDLQGAVAALETRAAALELTALHAANDAPTLVPA